MGVGVLLNSLISPFINNPGTPFLQTLHPPLVVQNLSPLPAVGGRGGGETVNSRNKKISLYLFLYIFFQLSFYLHFKDIMGQIQGRFLVWLPKPTDKEERVNLFFV